MNKEKEQKIQELQILEQNLQGVLMQKQAFQMELSEASSAIREVEKSKSEVYKIIGQLMVKKDLKEVKEELKNKEKLLNLRLKNLEKQEEIIAQKANQLKENILDSSKNKK